MTLKTPRHNTTAAEAQSHGCCRQHSLNHQRPRAAGGPGYGPAAARFSRLSRPRLHSYG